MHNREHYLWERCTLCMGVVSEMVTTNQNPFCSKECKKEYYQGPERKIYYILQNLFIFPSKQKMKQMLEEDFEIKLTMCEFLVYFEAAKLLSQRSCNEKL